MLSWLQTLLLQCLCTGRSFRLTLSMTPRPRDKEALLQRAHPHAKPEPRRFSLESKNACVLRAAHRRLPECLSTFHLLAAVHQGQAARLHDNYLLHAKATRTDSWQTIQTAEPSQKAIPLSSVGFKDGLRTSIWNVRVGKRLHTNREWLDFRGWSK